MAKTETLHIRVEPNVKQKAEKTLNDLGLSIADAINVFLNQIILTDGIPFEIKKTVRNSFEESLLQSEKDIEEGKIKKANDVFEEMEKTYGF